MKTLISKLTRFVRNDSGATAVEYGLIAALVGTALVAVGSSQYGFGMKGGFDRIGTSFDDVAKLY
jgi:pilus assembly protein Flp/PilA